MTPAVPKISPRQVSAAPGKCQHLSGVPLCGTGVLRLNLGQGAEGYIVEYRSNLGISAFRVGGVDGMLSFAIFAAGLAVLNVLLSIRMYNIRRELSLAVLAAGLLLLLLATIVSNALVALH